MEYVSSLTSHPRRISRRRRAAGPSAVARPPAAGKEASGPRPPVLGATTAAPAVRRGELPFLPAGSSSSRKYESQKYESPLPESEK